MIQHLLAVLVLVITELLLWYYLPLAWPDKVGICAAWLIVVFAGWVLSILLNSLPPTTPLEANDWNYLVTGVVKNELLGAAPLWVAARLVDFLIGGPAKRKARKKSGLAQLLQEGERLGNGNETAELPVAAMN